MNVRQKTLNIEKVNMQKIDKEFLMNTIRLLEHILSFMVLLHLKMLVSLRMPGLLPIEM